MRPEQIRNGDCSDWTGRCVPGLGVDKTLTTVEPGKRVLFWTSRHWSLITGVSGVCPLPPPFVCCCCCEDLLLFYGFSSIYPICPQNTIHYNTVTQCFKWNNMTKWRRMENRNTYRKKEGRKKGGAGKNRVYGWSENCNIIEECFRFCYPLLAP